MQTILKILLTAFAVVILSKLLPGVNVNGYYSAIILAVVLGILQVTLKPLVQLLALPVTIFTFGLFALVINAAIIMLADYFIGGFMVTSFWWALVFSVLLSVFQSIFFSFLNKKQK